MSELSEFESLSWPEANLLEISYCSDCLYLKIEDLVNIIPRLKYEIVEISVNGVESIHLSYRPFFDGKYQNTIPVLAQGEAVDEDTFDVFEAIARNNPFGLPEAEYYWVECWFSATNIEITRSGKFVYL